MTEEVIYIYLEKRNFLNEREGTFRSFSLFSLSMMMMMDDVIITHRALCSKVRSLTLDKWESVDVQILAAIGNDKANKFWEFGYSPRFVIMMNDDVIIGPPILNSVSLLDHCGDSRVLLILS